MGCGNMNCNCERTYDQAKNERYLKKTCKFVIENKIDISPADPYGLKIEEVERDFKYGGKSGFIALHLDCCFLGDVVVDTVLGKVMEYACGDK